MIDFKVCNSSEEKKKYFVIFFLIIHFKLININRNITSIETAF